MSSLREEAHLFYNIILTLVFHQPQGESHQFRIWRCWDCIFAQLCQNFWPSSARQAWWRPGPWGWGRHQQIFRASHEQLQCMHQHRSLLYAGSGPHLKCRGRSKPPAQVWRGAIGLFRFHGLDGGVECRPKTAHLLLRTCTEPLILKKERERGPFSPYSS